MITELQFRLMDHIAHNEMNSGNGATPKSHTDVDTWLWATEFGENIGINEHQVGGVISSLKQAGLVWTASEQTEDAGIGFTEEGFKAWSIARRTTHWKIAIADVE